ncbi:MAG: hypothetical protein F6J90_16350 [Moorea sp. SIOASIH]|nr:hypothetical protein [Moorena sp. SIOASIH]NEO37812.1 hypothetical protein [Moorena sp. SIOASIH]NEO90852.1 hypothetical protein [Moorena sp. SIO3G5]
MLFYAVTFNRQPLTGNLGLSATLREQLKNLKLKNLPYGNAKGEQLKNL